MVCNSISSIKGSGRVFASWLQQKKRPAERSRKNGQPDLRFCSRIRRRKASRKKICISCRPSGRICFSSGRISRSRKTMQPARNGQVAIYLYIFIFLLSRSSFAFLFYSLLYFLLLLFFFSFLFSLFVFFYAGRIKLWILSYFVTIAYDIIILSNNSNPAGCCDQEPARIWI